MQKEIIRRYTCGMLGLFLMALGIAFCTKSGLGTSPISALPYILSQRFSLSMGEWVFLLHCIYLLIQLMLLGRSFEKKQFLQLPLGIAFGFFNDFAMYLLTFCHPQGLFMQFAVLFSGCIILGIGIEILLKAKVIMIAAEACVAVIAKKTHNSFGRIKVIFDSVLVLIGLLLSQLFFGTAFGYGIGLGTLISAISVGNVVKITDKLWARRG